MPGPVPPQVIPRPPTWQPGGPAPWADVPTAARTGISLATVLDALVEVGQRGDVPEDTGLDRMLGLTMLVNAPDGEAVRHVNAGVLALMFEEHDETRLVLTRRSTALRTHRGEVSFPGGRLHEGETPVEGALREAHEEVDLDTGTVVLAGWLHPVATLVSSSLIVPVLATTDARPALVASPDEVERIFDVALAELAEPGVFHEERWRIAGRRVLASDGGDGGDDGDGGDEFPMWFFEIAGEMIWGATARMLHELLSIVLTGRSGL
ncbi:MAG TPA: CoA pyrophosphatase [Acidimicrobiales bacterium]|nr:CoA pyrophosphatase [Acidimicrobiales bacterium]